MSAFEDFVRQRVEAVSRHERDVEPVVEEIVSEHKDIMWDVEAEARELADEQ